MRSINFFFLLFISQLGLAQTIYVVNNTLGLMADFTTVQEAVDAAKDGDIIHIQHSDKEYDKAKVSKRLTIYGRSHSKKGFITKAYIEFTDGSDGSELQGIRGGAYFSGSVKNIKVTNCFLEGNLQLFESKSAYLYKDIEFTGNIFTLGTFIRVGANCSNITFKHNIIDLPILSDMVEDTLYLTNNIFTGTLVGLTINENVNVVLSNSLFIANEDKDMEFGASAAFKGNITFDNCYTYNYNTNFKYSFSNHETVTINNSKENVNPMFVKVNPKANSIAAPGPALGFNPDEDDLHLQLNSQVNDAGVYGK